MTFASIKQSPAPHDRAQHAALIDAVPASIALLGPAGRIVGVNRCWRAFATGNGLRDASFGIGSNYLAACDAARGEDETLAKQAAAGIRSVLDGHAADFSLEYPCHSPGVRRWFRMMVAPLPDEAGSCALVMHLDITIERESNDALVCLSDATRLRERILGKVLGSISDHVQAYRRDGRLLFANQRLLDRWGLRFDEAVGKDFHELGYPEALARRLQEQLRHVFDTGGNVVDDAALPGRDGVEAHYEYIFAPVFDARGGVEFVVGSSRDITERKQNELRIKRLNRGYIVVSQINALIVRAANRDELFREVCRIAIDAGGFRMAWIGRIDAAGNAIVPVTSAGGDLDEKIIGERLSLADDAPLGHGPSARAVRERRAIVVNDVATDPDIPDGAAHAAGGLLSLASLPIVVAGELVAVLGLHAGERGYFDDGEMALLQVLAHDIAFAVDHLGKADRLAYLAYHDVLTGLANRQLFLERAGQCLRGAGHAGRGAALVMIDLDRFKSINDSLGQAAGDSLLRQVAALLEDNLDDPTLLARVGNDHFVALLPHAASPSDAARQLECLSQRFHAHQFVLDGVPTQISATFGVSTYPDDATDAETMVKRAESAVKNAKAAGVRHLFYTQKMTESVARTLGVESRLRRALENGEFELHYQSKVRVASGGLCGAEALLRWNDPAVGLVAPLQFIPVLEQTGLILAVGRWILRQAIDDHARWLAGGLPVRIAVNVSSLQLRDPEFVADLARMLEGRPGAADGLEIEITESVLMADIEHSVATLQAIRGMGVKIAIDDFGTGFSSLAYLARLPVDTLKIDRSFVTEMTQSPAGLALVSTMITLAHSLDLKVVAEGVENEEEANLLRLLRCDQMQGYLFSRPVPAGTFEANFMAAG